MLFLSRNLNILDIIYQSFPKSSEIDAFKQKKYGCHNTINDTPETFECLTIIIMRNCERNLISSTIATWSNLEY